MVSILKRLLLALVCTLGVLVVFGLLIWLVEGRTTGNLYRVFGWGAVVVTGLVGTPVHELGHLTACKLFGLRVTDVALFRPSAGRYDGVLGYVSYSYDKNSFLDSLGCFFCGVAPLLFGAAVILLALRVLTPEIWRSVRARLTGAGRAGFLQTLGAVLSGFWGGLLRLRGAGIARGVLCLYVVLSVSMHMSLSPADIRGALTGLGAVLGVYLVFAIVTAAADLEYRPQCRRCAAVLASFMAIGLACGLLALGVSRLALLLA